MERVRRERLIEKRECEEEEAGGEGGARREVKGRDEGGKEGLAGSHLTRLITNTHYSLPNTRSPTLTLPLTPPVAHRDLGAPWVTLTGGDMT